MTTSLSSTATVEMHRRARDIPPWDAFVLAKNSDEFCRAWLALVCSEAVDARAAAILVEGIEAHTFVPIAAWPESTPDMARLSGVIEKALSEKRGVAQPDTAEGARYTHIAYPVLVGDRIGAVVALEMGGNEIRARAALRQIHWGSAWLSHMFAMREIDLAVAGRDRVAGVLDTVAVALRHGKFHHAVFEVTNELRQRFGCSRVAFGLVEHAAVKVTALSEAATFERNTPIVKAYTAAMNEAYDHGAPINASTVTRGKAAQAVNGAAPLDTADLAPPHPAHLALMVCSGDTDVLSYPMMQGAHCIAVITLEKSADVGFDAGDMAWLEAFTTLLAPIVAQRKAAERSSLTRLISESKTFLEKLFGPRHLVWKFAVSLTGVILALLVLLQFDYRVTAKTVIEGEVQRVVAAPFEGFIGASQVRAGDLVKKGQPLAQLDDRDLRIEQVRWSSERDQYDNRLREAMAIHDMTAIQVLGAQLRQAQAQLALVTEKIERAHLSAPYDGIVVSGDLSQQIGSPVESGKKLFEIAPLKSYRVILQVDEREIRHVLPGQSGQIVFTGMAGEPMPLTVVKVTPVATAQDGKNFFRVEASLNRQPERLRPGMEGIAKIDVGSRRLWWVLTHTFTDWLSLSLWTWMP